MRDDASTRLRQFTESTGWTVNPRFIGCWHVAVGRKCPEWRCPEQIRVDLPACGPGDYHHTDPLDHPRRATSPDGEKVLLCSPYVLDQRGATALTEWCRERELTWSAVPAGWYWPGVALSVIVRSVDAKPALKNWVPDPIRWERWK